MNYNLQLYNTVLEYKGLKEVPGAYDDPFISFAHKLCGIASYDVDATQPWCSSAMNIWVLITNAKINPKMLYTQMKDAQKSNESIARIFNYAKDSYSEEQVKNKNANALENTGIYVPEPTWDASAASWLEWGNVIPFNERKPGDMIILKRSGGNHVALYESEGIATLNLLGGNQNNMVCIADWYLKLNLIGVRREVI